MPKYRSKKSGRYVSEYYAKRHPQTTVEVRKGDAEERPDAGEFASEFMARNPETFRDLARR